MRFFSETESDPAVSTERDALTRGLNPLAALDYVRTQGGAPAIAQVLRALPKDDQAILAGERRLSQRAWVPFMTQGRLLSAIDNVLGNADHTLLFEVGQHMARRDIPRLFRPFLKLGNPGWVIEFGMRMWRYYHSCGRWQIERTPVTVLATLHDHPAHEAFCSTFVGWMTGALEMGGGVHVMVDHPVCHARGAPNCVYTCRWNRRRRPDEQTEPMDRFTSDPSSLLVDPDE